MKQILSFLFITLLLYSCQNGNKKAPTLESENEILVDTIAYAMLVIGFEEQFAAIEAEYDSASHERQLELEAEFEELDQAMVKAQRQFVREYPSSYQSLLVLREIDWSFESASEYRSYLDLLDPALHDSTPYGELDHLVTRMEGVEVGKQAPDFIMPDVKGSSRKLSDHYAGSTYLLLDFWASNCGPCRIENRNIVLAYEMYHDRGFDVLGVSTDTRKDAWLAAIEKDGLIWTNVCSLESWNENEVVAMYALRQTSQNFLLDASGKIIAKELRGEELITALEELFR